MARKRKSFAGGIASRIQDAVVDHLGPLIEDIVQDAVALQFGIPTGEDMVEQHVAKLITNVKASRSTPQGQVKPPERQVKAKRRAKAVAKVTTKAKTRRKKAPKKKKVVTRKASSKKGQTRKKIKVSKADNGNAGSTYAQMREKVLANKPSVTA